MAAPINPGSTKTFGKEKWAFVSTIATPASPSAGTEVNAASSLDISCFLYDDFDRPGKNTNTVTKKRRVCDTVQYQQIGVTQFSGGELTYSVDPQAVAGSNGKKAFEKLPAGTTGYLVRRLGIDVNTDFASGQFVDVFPVEVGPQLPGNMGDGETAEAGITQTFVITAAPQFIKALVA